MHNFRIPYREAQSIIPTPDGKQFAEVFSHGTLLIELYEPRGTDLRTQHTRGERYIVVKGSDEFVSVNDCVQFPTGDFFCSYWRSLPV